MEVIGASWQTARKVHWCDSCNRLIDAGARYYRARCTDGGEVWTFKAHEDCVTAAEAVADVEGFDVETGLATVSAMDREERAIVFAADADLHRRLWPGAPDPTIQEKD